MIATKSAGPMPERIPLRVDDYRTIAGCVGAALFVAFLLLNLQKVPINFGVGSVEVPASLAAVAVFVFGGVTALRLRAMYILATRAKTTGVPRRARAATGVRR